MIKTFIHIDTYPGTHIVGNLGCYPVHSFAWSESTTSFQNGGGGGAGTGRAIPSDVKVLKDIGPGSPRMFLDSCRGRHFSNIQLLAVESGERPVVVEKYVFRNATFDYFGVTDVDGARAGLCELHIRYRSITVTVTVQNSDGMLTSEDASFDFARNM